MSRHFQLGMDIGDAHRRRKEIAHENSEIDKRQMVLLRG